MMQTKDSQYVQAAVFPASAHVMVYPLPSSAVSSVGRRARCCSLLTVTIMFALASWGQVTDPIAAVLSQLSRLDDRRSVRMDSEWADATSEAARPPSTEKSKKAVPKKYDVSQIGDRGIGKGMNFYSIEKEEAIGKEMSLEVESQAKLLNDQVINEYVNRIGQNLVRNSDAMVPFKIKIVQSEEVNAFALPGGYFYVNTGLIMAADSEAELAGVMAHEIAHVAARHATKNMTKGQLFNFASIPLIFIGGPVGYAVQQAAGIAMPMSFLKFSRDAEREADLLGLEYQYKSGYDPGSFVAFFEKIKAQEKQKGNFISKAFATHPMTADRVSRAQKEIAEYLPPKSQYIVDTSEFVEIKARLASLLNERKLQKGKADKPTLRRAQNGPDKSDGGTTDNDRPTLKRPPLIQPLR
jgi:predicted Zn-dependent protease